MPDIRTSAMQTIPSRDKRDPDARTGGTNRSFDREQQMSASFDRFLTVRAGSRGGVVSGLGLLGWPLAITLGRKVFAHLRVHGFLMRLPGAESVHVPVVHRERRSDQHGVVNLDVSCA